MRLGHIEIFVSDPMTSKDFYVDVLGFRLEEIQSDQFVWLSGEGCSVLLRPGRRAPSAATYQETAIGLVLYTSQLQETVARLEADGVRMLGMDGECCPTFCDPDGNWIQLVDPEKHR